MYNLFIYSYSSIGTNKRVIKKKSKKSIPIFARTTRIHGLERWINELVMLQSQSSEDETPGTLLFIANSFIHYLLTWLFTGIAMVIELAKELLYSGVPEQVIELYAAYYDLILKRDNEQVSFPR